MIPGLHTLRRTRSYIRSSTTNYAYRAIGITITLLRLTRVVAVDVGATNFFPERNQIIAGGVELGR
jgi:hypothetical protein